MDKDIKTVGELIDFLQQYPRETRIVTGGFDEWGYDDFDHAEEVTVVPVAPSSHGPDYEEHPLPSHKVPTGEPFKALFIN